jgi:TPR repeat protein
MRLVDVARTHPRAVAAQVTTQVAPQPVPARIVPRAVATERVMPADFEPAAFADRMAAFPVKAEPTPVTPAVPARALQPERPAASAPALRKIDEEEISMLIKRGEDLITQGDIAAARLTLTRAAEAGDARAALALGATYDAEVLHNLGVLGVVADSGQARAWYVRAAQFGSGEATRRLEQIAQSVR